VLFEYTSNMSYFRNLVAASSPLGVLSSAPTSWGDRTPNVLPEGMTGLQHGPAGIDPPVAGPDGGFSFNGHWVTPGKADYYDGNVQHTNDRAVRHYSQNVSEWQDGDTVPDQLTWFVRPPHNPLVPGTKVSYKMHCWSDMNRKLKNDPMWRAEFGTCKTAEHFRRTFALMGVQQSKQTILREKNSWNEENNFIILGRARMPNLWLAQSEGYCVGEGASLYVLYRRHRYDGNDAADPNGDVWTGGTVGSKRKEYEGRPTVGAYAKSNLVSALPDLELDAPLPTPLKEWEPTAAAKTPAAVAAADEYYWSIDPYVTYTRQPPHPMMYTGDPLGDPDNQFVGDWDHIGTVAHVLRGNNERSARNVTRARNALYPDEPGKDHLVDYFKLDCIEVMVRMGK
jgi:hypothetical protein